MWLWGSTLRGGIAPPGLLQGPSAAVPIAELAGRSCLGPDLERLRGQKSIVLLRDQLTAALALLELDGVVRRLVVCTPDLAAEHVPQIIRESEANAFVGDAYTSHPVGNLVEMMVQPAATLSYEIPSRRQSHDTEWVLLTSGTTGVPKLVLHTLASLTSAFANARAGNEAVVWSTFYDIRRYGGLQIYLRALRAGSMVLSAQGEPVVEFIGRAGRSGVTHISGTASHWRRVLMSGAASSMRPRYIRLSGEVADQSVLDGLHGAYPDAEIVHAFASTEAGVAFEVTDRQAGFPETLLDAPTQGVELKIENGTLRVRSPGNAMRYLGASAVPISAPDGFVDTGDRVELHDGRYTFVGRTGGVINVGGLKVYPEEVEAVINSHPWVQMSRVRARRNSITGAVVAAEVVIKMNNEASELAPDEESLRKEIIEQCAGALASYKVPALVQFVKRLEISAAGKLVRADA
jgi:acyl-coenzyme A synthetase/AMP-(fatty) acid ligase